MWNDIPLFVRRGAVIFTQDVVPSLGKARPTQIYVDAFPDKTETGATFYDDDGATYAYEEGNFSKQRIAVRDDGKQASFTVAGRTGPYQGSVKSFLVRFHGRAAEAVDLDHHDRRCRAVDDLAALQKVEQGLDRDPRRLRAGNDRQAAGRLRRRRTQSTLTGSREPADTAEILEAEDASLSGATPQTRPHVSTEHRNFTGRGYVDGLDGDQGRHHVHAQGPLARRLRR